MATQLSSQLAPAFAQFNQTRFLGTNTGRGVDRSVIWQLSSTDLKALPGTKIQLVTYSAFGPAVLGAQASNFALIPGNAFFQYKFNTTAYTLGNADNAFQIEYTGKTTALVTQAATGLVTLTSSAGVRPTIVNPGIVTTANSANLGLELTLVGTTPALTLGDGLLYVGLSYTVVAIFP
jgi:hypothetical protein